MIFNETKTRSLAKAIIWRIIATLITWGVFYIYTGKFIEAIEMTLVAAFLGIVAHYVHERVWNRIQWGKEVEK